MTLADHLFKRHRFDRLVMMLCVRWYASYKLSYRDPVEMMAERGLSMAHTTIMRLRAQARPPSSSAGGSKPARSAARGGWTRPISRSKAAGCILDRAVDKTGQTVDFYLSEQRDTQAAKRFFHRAILRCGTPKKVTLDGYQASHRAVRELKDEGLLPLRTEVRSCAYLNHIVEQDHRRVKSRVGPVLGFKRFANAAIAITGIELAQKLRKDQFKVHRLVTRAAGDIHDLWMAALVA
jgi:transposase-like protein